MSWSQVFKINKNMKRALNEQIRDLKCTPIRVITTTGTYTPEKTGLYKIICVGAGGTGSCTDTSESSANNVYASSGGGGGVAIITQHLLSSQSYSVTVSTTASFSNIVSATGGESKSISGVGGTASGGDYNFAGVRGTGSAGGVDVGRNGGGVGVYLTELSRDSVFVKYFTALSPSVSLKYGQNILGFGGGGPATVYKTGTTGSPSYEGNCVPGLPAAVIIIPLEMEE